MEAGIVGLPNVGKSTLFNALTAAGIEAKNYPFCTIEPNVGVVTVPDKRLGQICDNLTTEKVIPAVLRLVDIAGIVKGASEGEGLGNKFLTHIRQVDAIAHVVRCFEDDDITHVDGSVDPIRDIGTIDTELMLADLQVVENSVKNAERRARTGDKDAKQLVAILTQCQASLEEGKTVMSLGLNDDDNLLIKNLGLITAKRVLYVANVMEDDPRGESPLVQKVREYAAANGGEVVVVCAKIEEELGELDDADRLEMLESMGMEEPALTVVAQGMYHLLGYESYFTAGPKEVRAWTIPAGCSAPQAAGVIHSDFERGFIRAEVYNVEDLVELKTEAAIKAAGRMRVEGKSYVMQDGDVCHFLFNV